VKTTRTFRPGRKFKDKTNVYYATHGRIRVKFVRQRRRLYSLISSGSNENAPLGCIWTKREPERREWKTRVPRAKLKIANYHARN